MGIYIFWYVLVGTGIFFTSIDTTTEPWLCFARAVLWPLLLPLYLLKYGFYAIKEVWAD